MWFLGVLGRNVERGLGRLPYLLFYLVCGLGGHVFQIAQTPHSKLMCLGASGAISGVVMGHLLLYPTKQVRFWMGPLMGIIEALELRSMQANEGIGLEFIFIICAVVGGCLLTGGYGSVIGTFFGACILGMVQLGIVDSMWDSNWTYAFQGAILFAAVLLNTFVRSRARRAR